MNTVKGKEGKQRWKECSERKEERMKAIDLENQ